VKKIKAVFLLTLITLSLVTQFTAVAPALAYPASLIDTVVSGLKAAHAAGATPIMRVDGGEFATPQAWIQFLTEVNGKIDFQAYALAGPNEVETETWTAPECHKRSYDVDDPMLINCIGPKTSAYVNTISSKKAQFPNIKLLSPAWNLCSPVFPSLVKGLGTLDWSRLDGIAANVYDEAPAGDVSRINDCLNIRLALIPSDKPVIITETGAFKKNYGELKNQLKAMSPRVLGALLFNGFNTNPGWSQFAVGDGDLNTLCDGNCGTNRIGVNFALPFRQSDATYTKTGSFHMSYTLEIIGENNLRDPPDFGNNRPTMHRLEHPCNYAVNPEFNPLRPYPFNPCDPFIPKEGLTFACGNALDVKGEYRFMQTSISKMRSSPKLNITLDGASQAQIANATPYAVASPENAIYQCVDGAGNPTGKICTVKRVPFNVEIAFPDATLPVIGNTEGNFESINSEVFANNYLSWYLQGTHWSDPKTPWQDSLINYSGPMRKLFPQKIQDNIRVVISQERFNDIHNYFLPGKDMPRMSQTNAAMREIFAQVPLSSMEDVVGEVTIGIQSDAKGQPDANGMGVITQAEDGGTNAAGAPITDITKNALRLHISRNPAAPANPLPPYSDGRTYMAHLRETQFLSDALKTYANPSNAGVLPTDLSDYEAGLQKQGLSQNEINVQVEALRRRLVSATDKNAHKVLHNTMVGQVNFEGFPYSETPTRNTEIIDAYEYATQMGVGYSFPPESLHTRYGLLAPAPPIQDPVARNINHSNGLCGLDALQVSPPGDHLVDEVGWSIKGTLTYTQVFQYDPIPDANPAVGSTCRTDGAGSGCGPAPYYQCSVPANTDPPTPGYDAHVGTCQPAFDPYINLPTTARVTVSDQTPFIKGIYEDLVSGNDSVLRRFLPAQTPVLMFNGGTTCPADYIRGENPDGTRQTTPEFTVDSCVKPVAAPAQYKASGSTNAVGRHTSTDFESSGVKQANAELYFPYLGSLHDYFLGAGTEMLNLQRLLRPKDLVSVANSGPSTDPNRTLVALVLGQSNAANYGDTRHTSNSNVFVLQGTQLVPAADPLPGADGTQGSVWSRLGDMITALGIYKRVVFIPVAIGSAQVTCWVQGGTCGIPGDPKPNQYDNLMQAITNANNQELTITHILWQQGETDSWPPVNTTKDAYKASLNQVISSIRAKGVTAPFYTALASRCYPDHPNDNTEIRQAQKDVVSLIDNVLPGPDSDAIKAVEVNRGTAPNNQCHFSDTGLTAMARAWLGSIQGSFASGGGGGGGVGRCDVAVSGPCTVQNLTPYFGANAEKASRICHAESSGNPNTINNKCPDWSVGLFQINLYAHNAPGLDCRSALKYANEIVTGNYTHCSTDPAAMVVPGKEAILKACEDYYKDPTNNINAAVGISSNGTNWGAWSTAKPGVCNIQ